jgi:uncharacterized OB-fold protein
MGEANESFGPGVVYTETIVHAAPEALLQEAPYQLAIIELDSGGRRTVRILARTEAERVRIGDRVEFAELREGVPFYRKAS